MILTISTGKRNYADAACTLAASASRLGLPCSVITDGNIEGMEHLFDQVILTTEANAFRLKTMLPQFTPYPRTLYIDADSLINPNSDLVQHLARLEGTKFAAHEYARLRPGDPGAGKYYWANVGDIYRANPEMKGQISAMQSSVIYFESGARKVFESAERAYGSMLCRLTRSGHFPDELAFSIATASTGIYPSKLFNVGFLANISIEQARKAVILTKAGSDGRLRVSQYYRALALSLQPQKCG